MVEIEEPQRRLCRQLYNNIEYFRARSSAIDDNYHITLVFDINEKLTATYPGHVDTRTPECWVVYAVIFPNNKFLLTAQDDPDYTLVREMGDYLETLNDNTMPDSDDELFNRDMYKSTKRK